MHGAASAHGMPAEVHGAGSAHVMSAEGRLTSAEPVDPPPLGGVEVRVKGWKDDFMLIAEFCEQRGPVPLLILPPGGEGNFKLADFVVRIMAVDYQSESLKDPSYLTKMSEDTQVVIEEPAEGAFAYVHHFTLYDIHARGYVRPCCVSFVTRDRNKILDHFEALLSEITKVVRLFKTGNQIVFKHDLAERIVTIQANHDAANDKDSATVQEATRDDATLSGVCGEEPSSQQICAFFTELHSRLSLSISNTISKDERLVAFHPYLEKPTGRTGIVWGPGGKKAVPPLIAVAGKRKAFERKLRLVSEMCLFGFEEGVARLKKAQRHFARTNVHLEVAKEESAILYPQPSLLSVGYAAVCNFADPPSDLAYFRLGDRGVDIPALAKKARIRSNESNKSVSSQSSFQDARSYHSVDSQDSDDDKESKRVKPIKEKYQTPPHSMGTAWEAPGSRESSTVRPTKVQRSTILSTPVTTTSLMSNASQPSLTSSAGADEAALQPDVLHTGRYTGTRPKVGVFLPNTKAGVTPLRTLFSRFHWMRHVLYALLSGRPLLIRAPPRDMSEVAAMVRSLARFIPGERHTFEAWMTRPPTLLDLTTVKLAGISKHFDIPKNLEHNVSILDFERELLRTPEYGSDLRGGIVDDIATYELWPDEDTYLMHIYSVMLGAAIKARLYYYLCHVEPPTLPRSSSLKRPQQQVPDPLAEVHGLLQDDPDDDDDLFSPEERRVRFHIGDGGDLKACMELPKCALGKLNVHGGDEDIVKYFCAVVLQQQALDMRRALADEAGHTQPIVPPLTLDGRTSREFKNVPPT